MIEVSGVSKSYGRTAALTNVNLEVARGECVGLMGPNGSGRTTLLRILATLIRPSAGQIAIDGVDPARNLYEVRARLAYVAGDPTIADPMASVRIGEYLEFMRRARGTRRSARVSGTAHAVLARAGLDAEAPLGALSAGMRRRVALAAAISGGADLLLLDDPLQSLDTEARACFLEWLREARDSGATLVVALNDHRDATALCHRVTQLHAGRLTSPSPVSTLTVAATPA